MLFLLLYHSCMNFSSLQKRVPGEVRRTLDPASQPLRLSPELQVRTPGMHTTVLQLELEKSFCIVESTFKSIFFCRNTSDSKNYGCEKLWQNYRDWEDSYDVAQEGIGLGYVATIYLSEISS